MNIKDYFINITKPFSRFLARILDYSLFYAFFILPLFFTSLLDHDIAHTICVLLIPVFWIPFETLCISLFGTTPGKALFGIQVRDSKGAKLSLITSFKRAAGTWIKGLGLNLPVLNVITAMYQFNAIKKNGRTSTDKALDINIYHRKRKTLRTIIGSLLIAFFSLFFVAEYQVREVATSSNQGFFSNKLFNKGLNWTAYNDPEGAYAIEFPGTPEASSTHLDIPNSKDKLPFHAINYSVDKEGVQYSLNYTTLPKNWLKWKATLLLRGALKIISTQMSQAKILKKSSNLYNNYPALEFVMTKKNNLECAGRLVLVDNVLYKLEVTYPKDKQESIQNDLNIFLQSFDPK